MGFFFLFFFFGGVGRGEKGGRGERGGVPMWVKSHVHNNGELKLRKFKF